MRASCAARTRRLDVAGVRHVFPLARPASVGMPSVRNRIDACSTPWRGLLRAPLSPAELGDREPHRRPRSSSRRSRAACQHAGQRAIHRARSRSVSGTLEPGVLLVEAACARRWSGSTSPDEGGQADPHTPRIEAPASSERAARISACRMRVAGVGAERRPARRRRAAAAQLCGFDADLPIAIDVRPTRDLGGVGDVDHERPRRTARARRSRRARCLRRAPGAGRDRAASRPAPAP